MARPRGPNRDKAKELWLSSGKKRLLKDIAAELGEPESKIRKWKSIDKWDSSSSGAKQNNSKGNAPLKRGAPKGNKNAVGKGAPKGSQNNLKHGGYSQIYWDTLDETEKELIESIPKSEEELLIEQIKLYSVRERRVLQAIKIMKGKKNNQVVSSVTRFETNREFKSEEEEQIYTNIMFDKMMNGKKLPGKEYNQTISSESTDNIIARLENELTRIQRAKTRSIEALAKLNLEKERLELIKQKDDVEIEDTSETDGMIYG